MTVLVSEWNIASTTFIGVIAMNKGVFHYELYQRSENKENFVTFFRNLRKKYGKGKFVLYIDNIKEHKSILASKVYNEL